MRKLRRRVALRRRRALGRPAILSILCVLGLSLPSCGDQNGRLGRAELERPARAPVTPQAGALAFDAAGTADAASQAAEGGSLTAVRPRAAGALTGWVRSENGEAVGRGMVQVLGENGRVLKAAAPDADGHYVIDVLPAASYRIRLEPVPGYSIGEGESDPKSASVGRKDTTGLDFRVRRAIWFDDFTGYTSDAELDAGFANDPGGSQLRPASRWRGCTPILVNFDPRTPAMRYDYWNRVADPTGIATLGRQCADPDPRFSMTVAYGRRFETPRPSGPEVWFRMVSREGTAEGGFSLGTRPNGGGLYKFVLDDWENNRDLFGVQAQGRSKFEFQLRWLGFLRAGVTRGCGIHPHPGVGHWHTYVFGYDASRGFSRTQIRIYIDGQLVCDETVNIADPGGLLNIRPGWNMNGGPDQAQHRWIREVGLYLSRPSTRRVQDGGE